MKANFTWVQDRYLEGVFRAFDLIIESFSGISYFLHQLSAKVSLKFVAAIVFELSAVKV